MMDPYKELGVSPSATDDEIKTAYRNLVKKYHPDRYANAPKDVQDQVSEKVKRINTAYDDIKKMRSGGGSSQQGYGAYGNPYGSYGQQQGGGTLIEVILLIGQVLDAVAIGGSRRKDGTANENCKDQEHQCDHQRSAPLRLKLVFDLIHKNLSP